MPEPIFCPYACPLFTMVLHKITILYLIYEAIMPLRRSSDIFYQEPPTLLISRRPCRISKYEPFIVSPNFVVIKIENVFIDNES